MNYLALARKWRPKTFSELVGQEHITKGLINALNQNRIHHALLFTGTRGVGKTTIARIFAKALNCTRGVRAEPCLTCEVCLSIDEGSFIDLIEIDAASKTRVEDTRELLENVAYRPSQARYKIYLIDEVHMLSTASFNALLKTLEEPPEHVRFLLATTDPHKIPVTVLSRCLQLNLRHIDEDNIFKHLSYILQKEAVTAEDEALNIIANAARGSMRDALSLLDQMLLGSDKTLTTEHVKSVLGHTKDDYALKIIEGLLNHHPESLLEVSASIAREGGQYAYVLQDLMKQLHERAIKIFLAKDDGKEDMAANIQLFFQLAQKGHQELELAPCPRMGFEMTLIRMLSFKPVSKIKPPIEITEKPLATPNDIPGKKAAPEQMPAMKSSPAKAKNNDWPSLVKKLNIQGLALNALNNAWLIQHHDNTLELGTTQGHQSLFTPATIKRIEEHLSEYFGAKTRVSLSTFEQPQPTPETIRQDEAKARQEDAMKSIESDPIAQQLQQEFDGKIVKNSVRAK